jgi:hypothetical protein
MKTRASACFFFDSAFSTYGLQTRGALRLDVLYFKCATWPEFSFFKRNSQMVFKKDIIQDGVKFFKYLITCVWMPSYAYDGKLLSRISPRIFFM